MPKYFSQSLPYRRLQKFANGIWDEERKTFYPFICSNVTVNAKKGIAYFVHSVTTTRSANGIQAANLYAYWTIITENGSSGICNVLTPIQTQASDYSVVTNSMVVDVLCKVASPLTLHAGAQGTIVYAEIPADPAGGPVVIS